MNLVRLRFLPHSPPAVLLLLGLVALLGLFPAATRLRAALPNSPLEQSTALIHKTVAENKDQVLRLGFSYSMFNGVNENDARSTLHALFALISKEHNIPADPDPQVFYGTDSMMEAIRHDTVDALVISTDEYWVLTRTLDFEKLAYDSQQRETLEEYYLLVRKDSGITSLKDLHDKRALFTMNSHMRMGHLWCDLLLARESLPPAAQYFSTITHVSKPSRAVLDVFFKRTDCCLVTKLNFQAMAELNPQLDKQLTPLAVSPPLVPRLFLFRIGMSETIENHVMNEFLKLRETAGGRQALAMFQVDSLVGHSSSGALKTTIDLLNEYARLLPKEAEDMTTRLRGSTHGSTSTDHSKPELSSDKSLATPASTQQP